MSDAPVDPGLQPERTLLGWRRTSLVLGTATLLLARLSVDLLGPGAAVLGAAGLTAAAAVHLAASRRYRLVHARLSTGRPLPGAGVEVLVTTAAVLVIAVGCGLWVWAGG